MHRNVSDALPRLRRSIIEFLHKIMQESFRFKAGDHGTVADGRYPLDHWWDFGWISRSCSAACEGCQVTKDGTVSSF